MLYRQMKTECIIDKAEYHCYTAIPLNTSTFNYVQNCAKPLMAIFRFCLLLQYVKTSKKKIPKNKKLKFG